MSSPPRAEPRETAPGTFRSANAKRASSTTKRFSGPPRARTVPVIVPCQSYGNGPPAKVRRRSKSTGAASISTSFTTSTGPPTANVIRPRRRDPVLRTSIADSA
jgi:hypothetical protein